MVGYYHIAKDNERAAYISWSLPYVRRMGEVRLEDEPILEIARLSSSPGISVSVEKILSKR